jgi:hypothetical protein
MIILGPHFDFSSLYSDVVGFFFPHLIFLVYIGMLCFFILFGPPFIVFHFFTEMLCF